MTDLLIHGDEGGKGAISHPWGPRLGSCCTVDRAVALTAEDLGSNPVNGDFISIYKLYRPLVNQHIGT